MGGYLSLLENDVALAASLGPDHALTRDALALE